MKRSLWTAVLAAGVLLVAGCSSDSGSGSAASTTAESSAAAVSSEAMSSEAMSSEAMSSEAMSSEAMSSEAMSSEATDSMTSESGGASGSGSADVAPASLDEQTTTWFTTLCDSVGPTLSKVQTSASSATTPQQLSDALSQFGGTLSDTAAELKSTPPPTFEAGTDFANQVTSGLAESGPKLSALAQKIAAIKTTDVAALKEALSGLSTEVQAAIEPLQSVGQLPADVAAGVKAIPACKTLGS